MKDISDLRLTIDEEIDLEVIEKVYKHFKIKKFSINDLENFSKNKKYLI